MNPGNGLRALAWIVLTALCGCEDEATRSAEARCGAERDLPIQVLAGSRVDDNELQPGEPSCSGENARVFVEASAVFERIPQQLRPEQVTVHYDPEVDRDLTIETHVPSGAILLAAGVDVSDSQWLGELARVGMAGPRPDRPLARKIVAAIEAGVASYFVAVILAVVPSSDSEDPWNGYLNRSDSDPQPLGALLANKMLERSTSLEAALTCVRNAGMLSDAEEELGSIIEEVVAACPAEERGEIRAVLAAWLPGTAFL